MGFICAGQWGGAAGQKGRVLCSRHLPTASGCMLSSYKSTALAQTWRNAHCGFTVAKSRGASQICRIEKTSCSVQKLYRMVYCKYFSTRLGIGAFEHTSKRRLKCTSWAFQIMESADEKSQQLAVYHSITVYNSVSISCFHPYFHPHVWSLKHHHLVVPVSHLPAVRVAAPVVRSLLALCLPQVVLVIRLSRGSLPSWRAASS